MQDYPKHYFLCSLQWYNPYTLPSEDAKVLLWTACPPDMQNEAFQVLRQEAKRRGLDVTKYANVIDAGAFRPIKIMKPEALAKMRYKRLRSKLKKKIKWPMVVEDMLNKRSEYFSIEAARRQQERRQGVIDKFDEKKRRTHSPDKFVEVINAEAI